MEVEWIRHMDIDLKGYSFLNDSKFRGNVTIVETPADVETVVADGYCVAKVMDWHQKENVGLLIDWSEEQNYARSFENRVGKEWICKVTDI